MCTGGTEVDCVSGTGRTRDRKGESYKGRRSPGPLSLPYRNSGVPRPATRNPTPSHTVRSLRPVLLVTPTPEDVEDSATHNDISGLESRSSRHPWDDTSECQRE